MQQGNIIEGLFAAFFVLPLANIIVQCSNINVFMEYLYSYLLSQDHFDYQKPLFERLCLHYCVHGSSQYSQLKKSNEMKLLSDQGYWDVHVLVITICCNSSILKLIQIKCTSLEILFMSYCRNNQRAHSFNQLSYFWGFLSNIIVVFL